MAVKRPLKRRIGPYLRRWTSAVAIAEHSFAKGMLLPLPALLHLSFGWIYRHLSVLSPQSPVTTPGTGRAPHEWRITREMWLADKFTNNGTTEQYKPLKLVIIQHTVTPECTVFSRCAVELRNLQNYFINDYGYDIPYNFIVGNDGRVYEGRGWNKEGAHTRGYNRCSVGIGFIGDYREELPVYTQVTAAQMNRTRLIIQEGIDLGYIDPNYFLIGAKDVTSTASPGSHLYNAIRKWEQFDHELQFRNRSCDDIYGRI